MKYQSNILSDARGKLNGMVFTRGRYGAVIRNKVSPVQPDTSRQQLVKQNFGALSASFRGLTQSQINAWNEAAQNWPRTNVFGQQYLQSGSNLYVGLNTNLLTAGIATISNPPEASEMPVLEFTSLSIDVSSTNVTIDFTVGGSPSSIPTGYVLVVDATAPVSAGRNFVKNRFRTVTVWDESTLQPVNLWTAYSALFGAPTAGQKIFVRGKIIDTITGQATVYVQASTIVVP